MYSIDDFCFELYSQIGQEITSLFKSLLLNRLELFIVSDSCGTISNCILADGSSSRFIDQVKGINNICDIFRMPAGILKDNMPIIASSDIFTDNYVFLYPFERASSILLCPVKSQENLVGVLICHNSKIDRAWDSEDIIKTMEVSVSIKKVIEKIIALEELRMTEAKHRFILANARDALMTYTPEGTITYITNGLSQNYLGYDKNELVGKNCIELIHPDYLGIAFEFIEETKQGIVHEYHDYPVKAKNGNYYWIRMHCQPILTEKNELTVFVSVVSYIHKEMQHKLNLERSEEKYRLLAENMHDMIITFDLDGAPLYISPSITKILGFNSDEIDQIIQRSSHFRLSKYLTKESRRLVDNFVADKLSSLTPEALDANDATILDLELIHKNGTIVKSESCVSFMVNPRTKGINILTVTRKTSDRKNVFVYVSKPALPLPAKNRQSKI